MTFIRSLDISRGMQLTLRALRRRLPASPTSSTSTASPKGLSRRADKISCLRRLQARAGLLLRLGSDKLRVVEITAA